MRAAVPAALHERQMRVLAGVVNPLGREAANRLRQQMGVVRHLHALRDLRLRLLGRVDHRFLAFAEWPLERLLRAVYVDALAVLAGDIEEGADDTRRQIAVAEL